MGAPPCPWLNPSAEQEQTWEVQRQAALKAHRHAVADVMALRDRESRRRFLEAYRRQWGALSVEGLEMRVRQLFMARFGADKNV